MTAVTHTCLYAFGSAGLAGTFIVGDDNDIVVVNSEKAHFAVEDTRFSTLTKNLC